MKNLRRISNYSIAGLLAMGVLALSFFAYKTKVSADTIVPGYATAHVGLNVTVPDSRAVPFTVKFTPMNGSSTYYFKTRPFEFQTAGLNTVEWYIRKIPAGQYRVTLDSSNQELKGSPVEVTFESDKVNETSEFELDLGSPPEAEQDNLFEDNSSPAAEETVAAESPVASPTETTSTEAMQSF
jgi:hypothetical protein